MIFKDLKDFSNSTKKAVKISKDGIKVIDERYLRDKVIDEIVYNLALNENKEIKDILAWFIWEFSRIVGIYPSSIQMFYEAMGRGDSGGFTVPAVNIRGLTYDTARALVRAAIKNDNLAFIFEIAKSEMSYTYQRPLEYTSMCLGAAIKEGFRGPIFIQGDHFQINEKKYNTDSVREIESLKQLIKEAIDAGFYNIDIDTSTLVDMSKKDIKEQQRLNFETAASLTAFIRSLEPKGVTISVGGEIGEIGEKNSNPDELIAFMTGYKEALSRLGNKLKGISKISVQTGTRHGGVVLPDGTIAEVELDFETLKTMSKIAREQYGLSGAVQHGASTLPDESFHRFPETETAEVHLATGFQNIIYESKHLPSTLRDKMYEWVKRECAKERKEGETEEQFIYKTRKKAFGPFKKELMDISQEIRDSIGRELEEKFNFLFKQLNVIKASSSVKKHISIKEIKKEIPQVIIEEQLT